MPRMRQGINPSIMRLVAYLNLSLVVIRAACVGCLTKPSRETPSSARSVVEGAIGIVKC